MVTMPAELLFGLVRLFPFPIPFRHCSKLAFFYPRTLIQLTDDET
jgi:hypothetical protein